MDNNEHRKSEPPSAQQAEGAKSSFKRAYSDETERPPSAQQRREDTDEHDDDLVEEEGEEELTSDPAEKIVDFDWGKLHERYHAAMDNCHKEEGDLTQEFESLMAYFRIWAESGHAHETDRTFQRLQTRTMYVQNSENTLEKTRNHYTNVVSAFESALNLLKAHGFGG